MPDREFLETYPLYRKYPFVATGTVDKLPNVAIHMFCPTCGSEQTFRRNNSYAEGFGYTNYPCQGAIIRPRYLCASCRLFERHFLIKISDDCDYIMKAGQFPAWDISGNRDVEKLLGDHAYFFKRGLICESQGYGIGAFAYYRRIVEEIIDELLEQIVHLLSGDDLERYKEALEKAKQTRIATEKIGLVKDLLPAILRPNEMNPLSTLHSVLSEGLHAESDETCLQLAMAVREVLVFLASQVAASRSTAKSFTDRMKQLLDRKRES